MKLQDIYKKHLDANCGTGYEPRTVNVPWNGSVYTFSFDDPITHLSHSDMLEGTRTMDVRAIMPLSEAWKILSGLSETRFPCERFCFAEKQPFTNITDKGVTDEVNRYSADRNTMNRLVTEWTKKEVHLIRRIWIPEDSPAEIHAPIPAAGFNYEFKTATRGTPGHVIEFIGDLEKAILTPK